MLNTCTIRPKATTRVIEHTVTASKRGDKMK